MCYKPVQIDRWKGGLDFLQPRYVLVGCKKCLECKQKRASEWALRCMFEEQEHPAKCFITLTYADKHPTTGEPAPYYLRKKDLQDFKKRLRFELNQKRRRRGEQPIEIRTFDCGEYGDQNLRPHFHLVVFGYDFPDKWLARESDSGHPIYDSQELENLWGHGLATVQEVTLNAAAYCALYAAKSKDDLPEHLQPYPEFNTMSQGLGVKGMLERIETFLQTDEIFVDGKAHNIPQIVLDKHFGTRAEDKYNPQYQALKERRIAKSKHSDDLNLAKLDNDFGAVLSQKQYRKENAQKRLTRTL